MHCRLAAKTSKNVFEWYAPWQTALELFHSLAWWEHAGSFDWRSFCLHGSPDQG
jgi:hypothetical protein